MDGVSVAPPGGQPSLGEPGITADGLATEDTPETIAVELPPVSGSHHYLPALDGLRALAVAGVIAYHFGFRWANGGYLGVDFFFVLSGFLITGLLVGESNGRGTIGLRSFWFRRAKRLLPAVMLLLVVLSVYARLGGPNITASTFTGDGIATLFYYANWHLIFTHQSYFTQFELPSTLRHTWSLAIEEQFYLVWPLLIVAGLGLGRRRAGRRGAHAVPPSRARTRGLPRPAAFWCTAALATASAVEMTVLYTRSHGADLNRVYYGTDTRAFELLIGAALALMVTGRPDHSPAGRRRLHVLAPLAAVVLGVLWVTAGGPDHDTSPSAWMFRGGLVVAGLLAAVVIAGVAQPDPGGFGRMLSFRPLRWVGRISYGLYLWHWPVYVLMTDVTTGLTGWTLLVARLAATVGAATISFMLLERPVRRYPWRGWTFLGVMAAGAAVTVTALVLSTAPAAAPVVIGKGASEVRVVSPTALPRPLPPPIDLPAGRVPSAADPLRVMTIGDSVMVDGEAGIAAALQATGVVRVSPHGYPGWGFVNDPAFQHDLAGAISEDHPEVIVMMWSWDNADALARPALFRAQLTEAIDVMLAPGDGVDGIAVVQFPKIGPNDAVIDPVQRQRAAAQAEAGRRAFDRIVSTLPARYPGRITYLPVAPALEIDGRFSPWLHTNDGGWIRARKTDNVHLCPAGAAVLGAAVTSELSPMFHLPAPAPGWIDAGWTRDESRFGPPGACPDDQPPAGST
jgi:peptidoglycan/LPS O-acetylase OafA/YrhL